MKKYKIYFTVIVLFFSFSALFGQKGIDCAFLEQVLTENVSRAFSYYVYDTIYIYEEYENKYFTNCDLSHLGTKEIYIIKNEIPQNYDRYRCRVLLIGSVKAKGRNIEIGFINGRSENIPITIRLLTYRKKRGKYKLIETIVS